MRFDLNDKTPGLDQVKQDFVRDKLRSLLADTDLARVQEPIPVVVTSGKVPPTQPNISCVGPLQGNRLAVYLRQREGGMLICHVNYPECMNGSALARAVQRSIAGSRRCANKGRKHRRNGLKPTGKFTLPIGFVPAPPIHAKITYSSNRATQDSKGSDMPRQKKPQTDLHGLSKRPEVQKAVMDALRAAFAVDARFNHEQAIKVLVGAGFIGLVRPKSIGIGFAFLISQGLLCGKKRGTGYGEFWLPKGAEEPAAAPAQPADAQAANGVETFDSLREMEVRLRKERDQIDVQLREIAQKRADLAQAELKTLTPVMARIDALRVAIATATTHGEGSGI